MILFDYTWLYEKITEHSDKAKDLDPETELDSEPTSILVFVYNKQKRI